MGRCGCGRQRAGRSHCAVRSAGACGAGRVRLPGSARDDGLPARCRRWPMPASNTSIRSARRHPRPNWPAAGAPNLTPRQDAMLVRWGYPYVFDTWFFHMTLTRRLSAAEKRSFMPAAEAHFARAIATPRPGQRHLPVRAARARQRRSSSASACRCAVERGKEARHAVVQRSIVDHRFQRNVARYRDAARQPRGDVGRILASARRQPGRQDVRRARSPRSRAPENAWPPRQ